MRRFGIWNANLHAPIPVWSTEFRAILKTISFLPRPLSVSHLLLGRLQNKKNLGKVFLSFFFIPLLLQRCKSAKYTLISGKPFFNKYENLETETPISVRRFLVAFRAILKNIFSLAKTFLRRVWFSYGRMWEQQGWLLERDERTCFEIAQNAPLYQENATWSFAFLLTNFISIWIEFSTFQSFIFFCNHRSTRRNVLKNWMLWIKNKNIRTTWHWCARLIAIFSHMPLYV